VAKEAAASRIEGTVICCHGLCATTEEGKKTSIAMLVGMATIPESFMTRILLKRK